MMHFCINGSNSSDKSINLIIWNYIGRVTVCIRIVADFGSRIFQFTTNVVSDYNVHIYYNFGYYFYTLLCFRTLFSVLLIALARHTLLLPKTFGMVCAVSFFERIANVYGFSVGLHWFYNCKQFI